MRAEKLVESLIPLKPVDYLILLVLASGERHGYGILQEVEQESRGQVRLEPGNLYRTIRRLTREGLLKEADFRPAPEEDDDRRRYYCLTDLGIRVLQAETERLRGLLQYAERLQLTPEEP